MDLKALIAKMDQIESKKVLTESEDRPAAKKKETTWTDKSGKQHPATRVQGSKSVAADKDADKERKKHDKELDEMHLQSAIAKELLKEFNISIEEEETLDEAGNPWEGKDPAKAAAWAALSPQDQQWLGGADPTDQIILARAPNKGKPAATRGIGAATKPAVAGAPGAQDDATGVDAAVAQQAAMPQASPGMSINPETGEEYTSLANAPLEEPPGAEDDEGAATKPAAAQGGINPTVLNRYKELLDKLEGAGKKPAAAPAAKPATGAGTKPAAGGATMPAVDQMGNPTGMPANESKLADDQILAIIRSI